MYYTFKIKFFFFFFLTTQVSNWKVNANLPFSPLQLLERTIILWLTSTKTPQMNSDSFLFIIIHQVFQYFLESILDLCSSNFIYYTGTDSHFLTCELLQKTCYQSICLLPTHNWLFTKLPLSSWTIIFIKSLLQNLQWLPFV